MTPKWRRPRDEDDRRHSRLILSNGTWTAAQQGASTFATAVIALLLIRAVPVEEYGVYSYAIALVSIGTSIMSAGLAGLAVKAIVHNTDRASTVVTSILLVREAFALLGYVTIVAISLTSGAFPTVAATLLAGSVLFARAGDVPEIWYRAMMRSRETALVRISLAVVFFGVRIAALWLWPSIWVFLALFVAESLLASILILIRYLCDRATHGMARPTREFSIDMLKQSTPLLLSGLANQVNLRGDVIILQALMGSSAVAVYSAAARMSELAYFLPVVFMNATLPVLLKIRKQHGADSLRYRRFLQRSYDQAFWLGVGVGGAAAIGGSLVIDWFFGPVYAESKYVLWISVAATPFVFMAAVYSKWIIAEGVLWSSLIRHSAGAVANVALNFALIPVLGLIGSALATLVSYVIASYFATFFGRAHSRSAGIAMSLAMVAPVRIAVSLIRSRSRKDADD